MTSATPCRTGFQRTARRPGGTALRRPNGRQVVHRRTLATGARIAGSERRRSQIRPRVAVLGRRLTIGTPASAPPNSDPRPSHATAGASTPHHFRRRVAHIGRSLLRSWWRVSRKRAAVNRNEWAAGVRRNSIDRRAAASCASGRSGQPGRTLARDQDQERRARTPASWQSSRPGAPLGAPARCWVGRRPVVATLDARLR
jgi:hypothetical protein